MTAVQSVDHTQSKELGYSTASLPVDMGWDFIANGEFSGKPVRTFSENNLVSFMGRASYTLMDKYIMNIAVRRDGSSRFGKNNKWGTFPSIALAWRINQEEFLRNVSWIDNLKLRLSYGIVGNQMVLETIQLLVWLMNIVMNLAIICIWVIFQERNCPILI